MKQERFFDSEYVECTTVGLDLTFYKSLNLNTCIEHLRKAKQDYLALKADYISLREKYLGKLNDKAGR